MTDPVSYASAVTAQTLRLNNPAPQPGDQSVTGNNAPVVAVTAPQAKPVASSNDSAKSQNENRRFPEERARESNNEEVKSGGIKLDIELLPLDEPYPDKISDAIDRVIYGEPSVNPLAPTFNRQGSSEFAATREVEERPAPGSVREYDKPAPEKKGSVEAEA